LSGTKNSRFKLVTKRLRYEVNNKLIYFHVSAKVSYSIRICIVISIFVAVKSSRITFRIGHRFDFCGLV